MFFCGKSDKDLILIFTRLNKRLQALANQLLRNVRSRTPVLQHLYMFIKQKYLTCIPRKHTPF